MEELKYEKQYALGISIPDSLKIILDQLSRKYNQFYEDESSLFIPIIYPFFSFENTNLLDLIKKKILSNKSFTIKVNEIEIRENEGYYDMVVSFSSSPENGIVDMAIGLNNLLHKLCAKSDMAITIGKFIHKFDAEYAKKQIKLNYQEWLCNHISLFKSQSKQSKIFKEIETYPLQYLSKPPSEKISHKSKKYLKRKRFIDSNVFKYINGEWKVYESEEEQNIPAREIEIVTFNVLFDLYNGTTTHPQERWPKLINVLKESNAAIICLQEVTSNFLKLIEEEEWVKKEYYLSEISSTSEEESTVYPYGQCVLSKYPFTSFYYPITSHKRVLFTESKVNNQKFIVTNIHMPSLINNPEMTSKIKVEIMTVIKDRFKSFPDCSGMIVGDFNFMEEEDIIGPSFVDAWPYLKFNDVGYTFNVQTNPIAEIQTRNGFSKRFDRIYLYQPTIWTPNDIKLIGKDVWQIEENGEKINISCSDHYGLQCKFIVEEEVEEENKEKSESENIVNNEYIQEISDETSSTLSILKKLFDIFFDNINYLLVPVGSAALGTRTEQSDIDLLCISTISQNEFFKPVYFYLISHKDVLRSIRLIDKSIVPIIELNIMGVNVDIQYCQWKQQLNIQKIVNASPSALALLDKNSQFTIGSLIDSQKLLNYIPNIANYRKAFKIIKRWAIERGIYSNRFGFIGGYGYSILLANICNIFPKADPIELVKEFFSYYSKWNWDNDAVQLEKASNKKVKKNENDMISIMTVSSPYRNVARNSTSSTKKIFLNELKRADNIMRNGNIEELCTSNFLEKWSAYLKLTISAHSAKELIEWRGYVESRIIGLIVSLEQEFPVLIHLYPSPYKGSFEYELFYLIGIDFTGYRDSERKGLNFKSTVDNFISNIYCWNDITSSMYIEIKQVNVKKLNDLSPFVQPLCEIEDIQVEEEELVIEEDKLEIGPMDNKKGKNGKKTKVNEDNSNEVISVKKDRFKTSEEIYNQIKWDPKYNPSEFIVGYEDRFVGIIEVPFEKFRQDPDIFIPWHRVWYFKRGKEIVWDRKNRIDLVSQNK